MAERRGGGRRRRKKVCAFCSDKNKTIDYKNVDGLRNT
jgi:small subunit ribosomal protein S18